MTRLPAHTNPDAWLKLPGIRRILVALDAEHGHVRFVGGIVRDLMLGEKPGDIDLATDFLPDEVTSRLEAEGIKVVPTGIAHGTVTAVASGTPVEITSLRADVSTDGRRATVEFTKDWKADAARRDFTINALYADPLTGEIFDYFGGLDDLESRTLRFIGNPLQRIAEDHLRILRFFRFHARYGHGEPDSQAVAACAERANDLMALSRERIADELLKLLALPDPTPTVALMIDNGLFVPVIPEITSVTRLRDLVNAERQMNARAEPIRRLAALIPQDRASTAKIASRLKLSNKAKKRLELAAITDLRAGPQQLAYRVGRESAVDRLLLAGKVTEAMEIQHWPVPRLPIGGTALMARGLDEGPDIARTLKAIEDEWEARGFPTGAAFSAIVDQITGP
nr:CCA tRNA nucleotidyltransferase [uncultured Sphingomonas sp.]